MTYGRNKDYFTMCPVPTTVHKSYFFLDGEVFFKNVSTHTILNTVQYLSKKWPIVHNIIIMVCFWYKRRINTEEKAKVVGQRWSLPCLLYLSFFYGFWWKKQTTVRVTRLVPFIMLLQHVSFFHVAFCRIHIVMLHTIIQYKIMIKRRTE